MLVGIDEAGRGPVLGALVIGVCDVPEEAETVLRDMGVRDSKTSRPNNAKPLKLGFWMSVSLSIGSVDPW